MESSLAGDAEGVRASGLHEIVARLKVVCSAEAGIERAQSQYFSLRETESQIRTAFTTMSVELDSIQARLANWRARVWDVRKTELSLMRGALSSAASNQLKAMHDEADKVGLMDDSASALAKVNSSTARRHFENVVRANCIQAKSKIDALVAELAGERFQLPSFDADGKRSGEALAARPAYTFEEIKIPDLNLELSLSSRIAKAAWIWARKHSPFESMRDAAELEEWEENAKRRASIKGDITKGWTPFEERTSKSITDQLDRIFQLVLSSLDDVERSLEALDSRPLAHTAQTLKAKV
jgi:hypothetical protein